MTVSERRKREKQQRLNSILDAAEKLFYEKGLENTTIDDIAEAAEISKGTVYLYFKCKELIFIGIDHRGSVILKDYFREAASTNESGIEKTKAIGKAYFDFSRKYPHFFAVMNYASRIDDKIMDSVMDEEIVQQRNAVELEVMQILIDIIAGGIQDGSIRPDVDPMETSIFLWAMSNGVFQMHFNKADEFKHFENIKPDFLITNFYNFMHNSLANPEQRGPLNENGKKPKDRGETR